VLSISKDCGVAAAAHRLAAKSTESIGGYAKTKLYGEGSAVGLQLRVRFVPAALLAVLGTALAPLNSPVRFKARDWTGHVDRWLVLSLLLTAIAGVRLSPY
jgi:hypothetical protein